MNNPALRLVLAVVAGVIAGGLVVLLVETIGHTIFPPPPGTDLSNPAHLEALIASLPAGALAIVLIGWFLGSFAGATVATLIDRRALAAWIVAGIFICLTTVNFAYIPHPLWMMAAGIAIPLLSAWLVTRYRESARPA